MPLAVVGLSHHTAPVEVRERFVFNETETAAALLQLSASGATREAVLLSTCNRTELYIAGVSASVELEAPPNGTRAADAAGASAADDPAAAAGVAAAPGHGNAQARADDADQESALMAAATLLAARAGLPLAEARRHLYVHRGRDAVRHLFRVVTSLDSMVMGEAQIQGQVRGAYELAAALGGERRVVGPVLSRLFESALGVGGRVRAETSLGVGAASVPSAAIELARKIFGSLRGRRALVLGAGEMSELAITCLAAEGVRSVVVANRTETHADSLARRVGASAARFASLPELIPQTDIIATATAAPHAVLTRELMQRALPAGSPHPLLIVDIALPRDVEPAVGELENVFLYDIDDLNQIVDDNLERRRDAVPLAEGIVAQEMASFWRWYESLQVVPVIRALRERAEEMRRHELEKALKRLEHLAPADREAVDWLTRQLLNKVLHPPTVRLREAASNGGGVSVVDAARYLFDLDRPNGTAEE
jgi:glutamyl-tRNA reductase